MLSLTFVCHFNDPHTLHTRLVPSLSAQTEPWALDLEQGHSSLAKAYAKVERTIATPLAVFVHQDVVLPAGWIASLEQRLAALPKDWGVVGVFGTKMLKTNDGARQIYYGNVRDTFAYRAEARTGSHAVVETIDGMLVIKRTRDPDVRWDANVPGFHGYAEDLCCTAWAANRPVYALNLYTEHWCDHTDTDNDAGYQASKAYVVGKWASRRALPICTSTGLWS